MKMSSTGLIVGVALALGCTAFAGMEGRTFTGSKELEHLKTLAGIWTGTATKEATGQPVRVEYRVTAAGSAVVETLFPGTPQEMVSVYYDKNGALTMTHYCAFGNRPQMTLKNSTDNSIELELAPGGEIAADRESHMHALKLTFESADKMTAEWTAFEAGQKKSISTFTLTRVK